MATIKDQAPADPSGLTAEQVRAACEAFQGALDVAERMLAAYREMVERFRASGTLEPDDESRAALDALETDNAAFAAMDALDALRRPKGDSR